MSSQVGLGSMLCDHGTKIWSHSGPPLLNKLSEVSIRIIKDFKCYMNSAHDAHSPEH
jgi:hypothetical protein